MINKLFLILVSLPHIISVSAQNTVKIDKFDGYKFNFNTINNQYHIVEATSDLNNWLVVGHFNGDGNNAYFEDCRHHKKPEFQAYRILFQKALFKDGLYDREWVLEAIHQNGEIIIPAKKKVHSIIFSKKGRVTGKNDCNNYFGQFELINGNCISFPNGFASTQMFCFPKSLDTVFFNSLRKSKGFEIGEKLIIYFGDNSKNWLIFADGGDQ